MILSGLLDPKIWQPHPPALTYACIGEMQISMLISEVCSVPDFGSGGPWTVLRVLLEALDSDLF